MKSRVRFSADELRHIGFRIRAVRILTGLNQEEFSSKHDVPYISLKNWEQGKFTPRSESVAIYLTAIESEGIQVDPDWLYFGSGPGPIYLDASTKTSKKPSSSVLDKYIALFKEQQISLGLNPVISEVDDESMFPDFKTGDVLGGVFFSRQEFLKLASQKQEMQRPFLILSSEGNYAPRRLFVHDQQIFFNSNDDHHLREYKHSLFGKICWHHTEFHSPNNLGVDIKSTNLLET